MASMAYLTHRATIGEYSAKQFAVLRLFMEQIEALLLRKPAPKADGVYLARLDHDTWNEFYNFTPNSKGVIEQGLHDHLQSLDEALSALEVYYGYGSQRMLHEFFNAYNTPEDTEIDMPLLLGIAIPYWHIYDFCKRHYERNHDIMIALRDDSEPIRVAELSEAHKSDIITVTQSKF
jgi:hypothetical protein